MEVFDHFRETTKMVCHLIVQNGDAKIEEIQLVTICNQLKMNVYDGKR